MLVIIYSLKPHIYPKVLDLDPFALTWVNKINYELRNNSELNTNYNVQLYINTLSNLTNNNVNILPAVWF